MEETADDEPDFECRIDVAGFEAPDGIISLQITHSRQDFGRMQYWEEAQVFAPSGSGYKALTPSEIISDSTVCKQLVGKALLKESVNPKEDQAPSFDGLTPEEISDAMWVAAVYPHRVEFWKSGFAGIPSTLTVANQDIGACLVVRKGWL
jgi:hypothetical protein